VQAEFSGAERDLTEAVLVAEEWRALARADNPVDGAKHLRRSGREGDETEDFEGLHVVGTLPVAK